jgi:hypothetical protein
MSIGGSIFIIAIGAILRYAVSDTIEGVDLATVGLILMIAGAAALVATLLYASVWSAERRAYYRDRWGGTPPPE